MYPYEQLCYDKHAMDAAFAVRDTGVIIHIIYLQYEFNTMRVISMYWNYCIVS